MTADGNDNQGHLTREYGTEPMDVLPNGLDAFNAKRSVWLNFIEGLPAARRRIYLRLEEKEAWSAEPYLKAFREWQDCIPERVWIENYRRVYLRPYEYYGDSMFLPMLEGGKKTWQRAQYEKYQEVYMASRYEGSSIKRSEITIRANGNVIGKSLPVRMYCNCYINAAIGSGKESNTFVKAKKGELVNIPFDNVAGDVANATCYFYPANLYTQLGEVDGVNLGDFRPEQFSCSAATKLRSLAFKMPNGVSTVPFNDTLSFSGNDLLEELYFIDFSQMERDLDLTSAPSLKMLDTTGTPFGSIQIADGAPLEIARINKPTQLEMKNLRSLQEFTVEDCGRLRQVEFNNIEINKEFTQDIIDNMETEEGIALRYDLQEINWKVDKATDLDTSGEIPKIKTLEKLLYSGLFLTQSVGATNKPVESSITGTILVTKEAYNGEQTFEIQDQYASVLPELYINFEGGALLHDVVIYDGSDNKIWHRKIKDGESITEEYLKGGPTDFTKITIEKSMTTAHIYTFLKQFEIFSAEDDGLIDTVDGKLPLYEQPVTRDIYIKPKFKEETRKYKISFYQILQDGTEKELQFNSHNGEFSADAIPYGTLIEDLYPEVNPECDVEAPKDEQYYSFAGYSTSKNGSVASVSKPGAIVQDNSILYAVFKLEDDIRKVVHPEWFEFVYRDINSSSNILTGGDTSPSIIGKSGYMIYPKQGVVLPKKVTIPAYYNGLPVIILGSGNQNANWGTPMPEYDNEFNKSIQRHVTHVFYENQLKENDQHLLFINDYAFDSCSNLVHCDFPDSIVRYGNLSFSQCRNLRYTSLSKKTTSVGMSAFNGAFTSKEPIRFEIPASITKIGITAFNGTRFRLGSTLVIGGGLDQPSKLNLSDNNLSGFATTRDATIQKFISPEMNNGIGFSDVVFYTNLYKTADDLVTITYTVFLSDNSSEIITEEVPLWRAFKTYTIVDDEPVMSESPQIYMNPPDEEELPIVL